MDLFQNIQTSLFKIKSSLKGDSSLRKLLYYTTTDPKSESDVSYTVINDFIYLNPVFDVNIEPYNKSNFISVTLVELEQEEDDTLFTGVLRLDVISKNTLWELDNNEIRPLAIISRIYSILNNTKFNISHKLQYKGIQQVVLNEQYSGYIVLFDLVEGAGLENEF